MTTRKKTNFQLLQNGDDAQQRLAQGLLGRDLAVLFAVRDVLGLAVDEENDQQADDGECKGHGEEDGRYAQPAAHEIGDGAAADRADVDDHVENAEAQRGAQARCLLHRAGDAGLDDRAAQADEDDAQQDRHGEIASGRQEGLNVAHDQVAQGEHDEGGDQGALEAVLVGQGAADDGQEVDQPPEERAVEERGERGAHAQVFRQVDDHERGHGVIGAPFEKLDGVGRPESGGEARGFAFGRIHEDLRVIFLWRCPARPTGAGRRPTANRSAGKAKTWSWERR